jgi:hypothetical protein
LVGWLYVLNSLRVKPFFCVPNFVIDCDLIVVFQIVMKVVCPDCGLVSKTFDPYFSVSLPLAKESATEMAFEVIVVRSFSPTAVSTMNIASGSGGGVGGGGTGGGSGNDAPLKPNQGSSLSSSSSSSSDQTTEEMKRKKKKPQRKRLCKYTVQLPRQGPMCAFRSAAAAASGLDAAHLVVAEVFQRSIYKVSDQF